MNILIFTTAFHPSIGGLEKQTIALIYEFVKKGHTVKVIIMQFQTVIIKHGDYDLKEVEICYHPNPIKKLQLFLWCTIFYMPNLSLKGIWLLFFNPFKNWVVSHNDFYLSNKKSLKIRFKLFLIKFASHNIAVSKSVAKYLTTKSTVIFNCYDNDIFKIYSAEEKIFDFVFLGRLVSQKGCDLLIKACKSLNKPFTLNIIGDGPERQKLEQMVKDAGLEQNIRFLGILEEARLAIMLNRHKTMVIPSIGEEGFGIVALEGLACGCRVIAADAGGLAEAVSIFGKTFKMGDQQALENLLQETMEESKEPTPISVTENLSNYLLQHRKDAIAQQYLHLFE